jgi:hypothetical protein
VPRDDVRVGEVDRYIERKLLLRAGKEFRRGEEVIAVRRNFNSRFSVTLFKAREILRRNAPCIAKLERLVRQFHG